MLKKGKLIHITKIVAALLAAIFFVVGCDSSKSTPKKKVIKKVVVVQPDDTSSADSSAVDSNDTKTESSVISENYDFNDDTYESNNALKEKRPLAEREEQTNMREQEYTTKAVAWNGPKGYTIVYQSSNRSAKSAALKLQAYFKSNAGLVLPIADDSSESVSKEILVGDTNRRSTKLKPNEYAVSLEKDTLIVEGGHAAMVETAADWFVSLVYNNGKVNLLNGQCSDFVSVVKGDYKYVWGDEFSGNSLDMNKWCFEDKMGGTSMMPCLRDSNVVNVNEGLLKLTAVRYYNPALPMAQYATNSSVCTQNTMSYKYGYLEIRAKVPFKQGAWPSFWLVSGDALNKESSKYDYDTEIDIFEVFSSADTLIPNIHKWYHDGTHSMYNGNHYKQKSSKSYVFDKMDNLVNEYHTYGFEWTPEKMVMSVDGADYMTYDLKENFDGKSNMEGFNAPLLIIFNNFIYAPDQNETNESNKVNNRNLPFEYFIDYIRLYQRPGIGSLNFSDTTK